MLLGAAIGSIIPGVGTLIGAGIGSIVDWFMPTIGDYEPKHEASQAAVGGGWATGGWVKNTFKNRVKGQITKVHANEAIVPLSNNNPVSSMLSDIHNSVATNHMSVAKGSSGLDIDYDRLAIAMAKGVVAGKTQYGDPNRVDLQLKKTQAAGTELWSSFS